VQGGSSNQHIWNLQRDYFCHKHFSERQMTEKEELQMVFHTATSGVGKTPICIKTSLVLFLFFFGRGSGFVGFYFLYIIWFP
jgi:hypothetical protein